MKYIKTYNYNNTIMKYNIWDYLLGFYDDLK